MTSNPAMVPPTRYQTVELEEGAGIGLIVIAASAVRLSVTLTVVVTGMKPGLDA